MIGWLIGTLTATTLLCGVILLVRRPVARWFGAGAAYALWALVAMRQVIPAFALPVAPLAAPAAMPPLALVVEVPGSPGAGAPPVFWPAVLALWLSGVAAFALWRWLGYRRMRAALLAEARPVGEVGKVRLVESPAVPAPLAFGLFDKVVALPTGFMAWQDRESRDLALAHELQHHRGHDLAANLLAQAVLALHWFNPVAWLAWHAMRRDQEAACDARVLAKAGENARPAYARLLTAFAAGPRPAFAAPMACPVVFERSIIQRLRSLAMPNVSPLRRTAGRVCWTLAALALPLTAAHSGPADQAPASNPAQGAPDAAPAAPPAHRHQTIIIHTAGEKPAAEAQVSAGPGNRVTIIRTERAADGTAAAVSPDGKQSRVIVLSPAPGATQLPAEGNRIELRIGEGGGSVVQVVGLGGDTLACQSEGAVEEGSSQAGSDAAKSRVRVMVCGGPQASAGALEALRRARESMAGKDQLSDDVRQRVLEALDRQIARLSKTV